MNYLATKMELQRAPIYANTQAEVCRITRQRVMLGDCFEETRTRSSYHVIVGRQKRHGRLDVYANGLAQINCFGDGRPVKYEVLSDLDLLAPQGVCSVVEE